MAETTSARHEGGAARHRRFVYVMASIAALGGLLFGFDTGVISGALLFIRQDFNLNAFTEGFIVSSLLLGAMVGAGVSGALSDRLGRRTIILVAAVVFAVGAIGAARSLPPSRRSSPSVSCWAWVWVPLRLSFRPTSLSQPRPMCAARSLRFSSSR
jgi:MFS family permease